MLGRGKHWEGEHWERGSNGKEGALGRGEHWERYSTKSVQKSIVASDSKAQCLVLTEETHKY